MRPRWLASYSRSSGATPPPAPNSASPLTHRTTAPRCAPPRPTASSASTNSSSSRPTGGSAWSCATPTCVDGSRAVLVDITNTTQASTAVGRGTPACSFAGIATAGWCARPAAVLAQRRRDHHITPPAGPPPPAARKPRRVLDDNCAVASAALALDRRPLSVFVAASGQRAALFSELSFARRANRRCGGEERRGDRHPALRRAGSRQLRAGRAGFAGETCDVTDAPPPPLDVLAGRPPAASSCWWRAARRLRRRRAALAGGRRAAGQHARGRLRLVRRRATLPDGRRMAASPCGCPPASAAFHVVCTTPRHGRLALRRRLVAPWRLRRRRRRRRPRRRRRRRRANARTRARRPSAFAVAVVALGAACAPRSCSSRCSRVQRGGGGSFAKLSTDGEAPPRPPPGRGGRRDLAVPAGSRAVGDFHYASVVSGSKPRETDSPRSVSERKRAIEATGARRLPGSSPPGRRGPRRSRPPRRRAPAAAGGTPPPPSSAASGVTRSRASCCRARAGAGVSPRGSAATAGRRGARAAGGSRAVSEGAAARGARAEVEIRIHVRLASTPHTRVVFRAEARSRLAQDSGAERRAPCKRSRWPSPRS